MNIMEQSDRIDGNDSYFNPSRHEEDEQAKADIVHPTRLQGFSDAVFATAATILVIPLKKFELKKEQTLSEALAEKWIEFIVFVIGFLLICAIWENRVIRRKVINKVDDVLVALNLISLMITTFLPFAIALESYFGRYSVSILLTSLLLLALLVIEAIIFVYSFNMNPYLLSERIQLLDPMELKAEKNQLVLKFAIDGVLMVLAAALSYTLPLASRLLVSAILITPLLIRLFARLTKCSNHCQQCQDYQSPFKLITGSITKERLECFSDAAVAIIATLLILDLTTEEFPTEDQVSEGGGLENVLSNMWKSFTAYVATYAVIAFMWFVNHSILHHVKVFNPKMIFINKLFLAFVAYTPFIMKLLQNYINDATSNSIIAIRFSVCVLFAGGFCNVLLLVTAVWEKETTMYEWAWPKRRRDNKSNPVHTYLFFKTWILPFASFVAFMGSLSSHHVCYVTFHVAIFSVPVIFLSLKIAFACQFRVREPTNTLLIPRSDSPAVLGVLPGSTTDPHISMTNRRGIDDDSDSD